MASIVGFYCAIGTIDGAGYPSIHGIGAVFFFIVLYILSGAMTIVMRELHNWDATILNKTSITIKTILVGYVTAVALYCGVGGLIENIPQNDDDIYVVIIEWNLTLICLVWLLSFTLDFKDISITLRGDVSKTVKLKSND